MWNFPHHFDFEWCTVQDANDLMNGLLHVHAEGPAAAAQGVLETLV